MYRPSALGGHSVDGSGANQWTFRRARTSRRVGSRATHPGGRSTTLTRARGSADDSSMMGILSHAARRFARRGAFLSLAFVSLAAVTRTAGGQLPDSLQRLRPDSTQRVDSASRRPDPRPPIRLCAGGDVTLGTNLDTAWARLAARRLRDEWAQSTDPDSLLFPLRSLLTNADVVLLNVEGAIGEGRASQKCAKGSKNCYAFRQPTSAARALRSLTDGGVLVGNVANNHSRDAGGDGFRATLRHLTRAGVLVTGADTLATPVVTARGDTIAVLGFYTSSDTPDARDLAAVRRHVERAVARYGTVVVTMHLGAEGPAAQRTRNETELFLETIDRGNPVAFADAAFEAGATLVIGHGPHVLRAAEWRGDRLVIYSLGNLLTYGPFRNIEPMNRGAILCAEIDSARTVRSARLVSTVQLAPGILRADSTARAATLIDSLSAIDFPSTGVLVSVDGELRRRAANDSTRSSVPDTLRAAPPSRR